MYRLMVSFLIFLPFLGVVLWVIYVVFKKFSIKILIVTVFLLAGLYYSAVLARVELSARRANKYAAFLLHEITQPWSAKQMRRYGTKRFRNQSKRTPEEIAITAEAGWGSLQKIVKGPDCAFKTGRFADEVERILFTDCDVTVRYEKVTARMKIRLVDEPEPHQPTKLFGLLGDSLKFNNFSDIEIVN